MGKKLNTFDLGVAFGALLEPHLKQSEREKYMYEISCHIDYLEKENQKLQEAAKDALSLLRCEKEFPEDLCIKVGNVVRHERVVRGLEQALAELEGGQ